MENISTDQQIFESLNKANRILVALPQNPNGDSFGSGLALFGFLRKLDKQPEVATAAKNLASFQFLPMVAEVKQELAVSQSFVISVATTSGKLEELSYETKEDRVEIFLKAKEGKFSPSDVTFRSARFPYDLIITVGTPSLDHLGDIYEKNTDLFFETPIINIDHHPSNEYYGEINHVDLTATSTSEIIAELIENYEAGLIDEAIATNLLTGIIVETNSFQHAKTTPKAFMKASRLIAQGGRHQDIIRELYKTKSISLLKLWGRSLARIKEVPELGLIYSMVSQQDIEKTGSHIQEIYGVMKELVASLAGSRIVLFLAESAPSETLGYFYLHPSIKSQTITSALEGQMVNGAMGTFRVKSSLLEAEKQIVERLRKIKSQIVPA